MIYCFRNMIYGSAAWYTCLPQVWYNIRSLHTQSVYHLRSRYHIEDISSVLHRTDIIIKNLSCPGRQKRFFYMVGVTDLNTPTSASSLRSGRPRGNPLRVLCCFATRRGFVPVSDATKKDLQKQVFFVGRSDGTWTHGPQTPSLVRYQLRYTPKSIWRA